MAIHGTETARKYQRSIDDNSMPDHVLLCVFVTSRGLYDAEGTGMIINLHLNDKQAEQLLIIYGMVNDPEVYCIEDYAGQLFSDLLARIWNDVRRDIMN